MLTGPVRGKSQQKKQQKDRKAQWKQQREKQKQEEQEDQNAEVKRLCEAFIEKKKLPVPNQHYGNRARTRYEQTLDKAKRPSYDMGNVAPPVSRLRAQEEDRRRAFRAYKQVPCGGLKENPVAQEVRGGDE